MRQRTLARACALEGVGLHTGGRTRVTLRPAPGGYGVRFVRIDLAGAEPVQALARQVVDTRFATSLGNGHSRIDTVEHLMAALYGCGVDNALVEVEGLEVPILDGSAGEFVAAIEGVGMVEQDAPRRFLRLRAPVQVGEGERLARLVPAEDLELSCTIGFSQAGLAFQQRTIRGSEFREQVARARTFGFVEELESLRAAGLIRGGSLENALVWGAEGWVNPEQVRFEDEPVRHKLLDAVGDLALCGGRLLARYEGVRAGHTLNVALVRALEASGALLPSG